MPEVTWAMMYTTPLNMGCIGCVLKVTQGMDACLDEMESLSREIGAMSSRFEYAEYWHRRSHFGFGPENLDLLQDLLKA